MDCPTFSELDNSALPSRERNDSGILSRSPLSSAIVLYIGPSWPVTSDGELSQDLASEPTSFIFSSFLQRQRGQWHQTAEKSVAIARRSCSSKAGAIVASRRIISSSMLRLDMGGLLTPQTGQD